MKFILAIMMVNLSVMAQLVLNIKSDEPSALIAVAVYNNAQGFPSDSSKTVYQKFHSPSEFPLKLQLPKGNYAVALYQDLNGSKMLETGFFGKPKEPYGFSNNPSIWFRAPKFDECSFELTNRIKEVFISLK